jgi:hypothetical protein
MTNLFTRTQSHTELMLNHKCLIDCPLIVSIPRVSKPMKFCELELKARFPGISGDAVIKPNEMAI